MRTEVKITKNTEKSVLAILGKRKESEIVAAVLAYLRTVPGVFAFRANTGAVSSSYKGKTRFMRFGFPGCADILGWRQTEVWSMWTGVSRFVACFLAIEIKTPGWKPRNKADAFRWAQQQGFLASVTAAGGIGFVAHDVEEVVEGLK